jgi:hypothetical protein
MGAFMLVGLEFPTLGVLGAHRSLPQPEPALRRPGDPLAAIAGRQSTD